jgi:hypothetical protein
MGTLNCRPPVIPVGREIRGIGIVGCERDLAFIVRAVDGRADIDRRIPLPGRKGGNQNITLTEPRRPEGLEIKCQAVRADSRLAVTINRVYGSTEIGYRARRTACQCRSVDSYATCCPTIHYRAGIFFNNFPIHR